MLLFLAIYVLQNYKFFFNYGKYFFLFFVNLKKILKLQ